MLKSVEIADAAGFAVSSASDPLRAREERSRREGERSQRERQRRGRGRLEKGAGEEEGAGGVRGVRVRIPAAGAAGGGEQPSAGGKRSVNLKSDTLQCIPGFWFPLSKEQWVRLLSHKDEGLKMISEG